MERKCKNCFLPLGASQIECSNCGAQNPIPIEIKPMSPAPSPIVSKQRNSLIGCLSTFATLIVIIVILAVVLTVSQCSYNAKDEVEYSSEVGNNSPAYIKIKSIVPKYNISNQYGGGGYVGNIVCQCITTSGKTVWLYISTTDYEKYIDPEANLNGYWGSEFDTVTFPGGIVIHGKVRTANHISDDLSRYTGKTVLQFETIDRNE